MEKDSKMYEYGCLMVYLKMSNWAEFTKDILDDDLYDSENSRYGMETEPHCTILYGLHPEIEDEDVKKLFENIEKEDFDIQLAGKDCFYNDEYDVLKINIISEKLNELHELAKNNFDYTSQYSTFKPHITIAYLKKGRGKKYVDSDFEGFIDTDSIEKIVYSKTNGEKIDIHLS